MKDVDINLSAHKCFDGNRQDMTAKQRCVR